MNGKVSLAFQDVEDEVFWKAIYVLLHAVFPALKEVQYCDSNTPSMDKINHFTKQAWEAIMTSVNDSDDEKFFGPSGKAAMAGCDEEIKEFLAAKRKWRC